MESNTYLISPNSQYRQQLLLMLDESELEQLHMYLAETELNNPDAPKVAKDLRAELWYMLLEVREFNAYLKQGGRP